VRAKYKKTKSHLVLIAAIGIVTFMFSQGIIKSHQADGLLGFSSDTLAVHVVGLALLKIKTQSR
jgi:hypothetical protein